MKKYTDQDFDSLDEGQNYYQHVKLADIVNDFMLAEVGEGMLIPHVKKQLVEFHAQRAIQEFSYDTLRTVKSREYELDGNISFGLPQDFVNIVGVFWLDGNGYKHYMNERKVSGNPEAPLYDSEGGYIYDAEGNRLDANSSTSLTSYNAKSDAEASSVFYNYFAGSFENEDLYDRYYSYYGRRFGADPRHLNINGTYVHDNNEHLVFIDTGFTDRTIVLDYVSDGIGSFDTIKVHKFAEEAVYGYIRFRLVYGQRNMPLYEKQMAKKEYAIAKRRAKHRLSGLGQALEEAFKGKSKWIKH